MGVCNQQRRKYLICYREEDFIVTQNPNNSHGNSGSNKNAQNKFSVWIFQKLYIAISKYPFIQLFSEIINALANGIKVNRLQKYL